MFYNLFNIGQYQFVQPRHRTSSFNKQKYKLYPEFYRFYNKEIGLSLFC
jgi:hypothetical protein